MSVILSALAECYTIEGILTLVLGVLSGIIIGALPGLSVNMAIALLFRLIFALQADGTEDLRHALGVAGTVYLRIPPSREGRGKVNIMLDGRLVEKDAVTDEAEMLNYGEQIVVIGISGGTELIVRKKAK